MEKTAINKSLDLYTIAQEKIALYDHYTDVMEAFAKTKDVIDGKLYTDVAMMMFDAHKHKSLEIVTVLEEMRSLVESDENITPELKQFLLTLNEKITAKYRGEYDFTKSYMNFCWEKFANAMK